MQSNKQNKIIRSSLLQIIPPLLLFFAIAYAHSGRVDGQGRHMDTSTGEYHYHSQDKGQPITSCGMVVKVVDGDTFDINIGGVVQRVRLNYIDAPELDTSEGVAAKNNLAKEIEGKEVCIIHHNIRGHYHRLLIDDYYVL